MNLPKLFKRGIKFMFFFIQKTDLIDKGLSCYYKQSKNDLKSCQLGVEGNGLL